MLDMMRAFKSFFSFQGPGRKWRELFMQRHAKALTQRAPEKVGKAAANVTSLDLDEWFRRYERGLFEEGILHLISSDDRRSINLDESGFELNANPKRVVASRSIKHTYMVNSANTHERVTVTICVGADGHVFTPQIIFKTVMSQNRMNECIFASGSMSYLF